MTPGTWQVTRHGALGIISGSTWIATVHAHAPTEVDAYPPAEEAESNALCMAVAPELLEFARSVVRALGDNVVLSEAEQELYNDAHAVIHRAVWGETTTAESEFDTDDGWSV